MISRKQPLFHLIILPALCMMGYQCSEKNQAVSTENKDVLEYVNPFIGTGGHGHTYPGASSPFGMVQLSPDTRLTGWDGCSGYHYSDDIIYGFSHTHLSGTGVSDYGDILLMPVNHANEIKNSKLDYEEYQSAFSHDQEKASPGFYQVYLEKPEVEVSLSTTPRCGIHRYDFKNSKDPAVVLDLEHRDEVLSCNVEVIDSMTIVGHRHSNAWATDQRLFFVIEFSKPFVEFRTIKHQDSEHHSKGLFLFEKATESIVVKVGISAVDIEGARKNLKEELQPYSFEEIKEKNETLWRNELNKIEATFGHEDEKAIFYTSLYHSMLAPNLYQDVDGRYRGVDLEIHQNTEDHKHYTVFSLWDTYRATHPLYTIMDQERTNDFVRTMIQKYEQGGIIPIWDLSACYTGCMIGYHGVSVIADAYIKGIRDYDTELAFEAIKHSAMQDHLGLKAYKKYGFIPVQKEAESVSKTLEYSYDDWCIAQMSQAMEKEEDSRYFLNRSLNYRNIFDPESGFFRPRAYNFWKAPFDPYEVNNHYTEANAWHYGFSAVHDMDGFIDLHGGKKNLEKSLDELFTTTNSTTGRDQADITGLIGQYAHGNEPSHHIAYLYNYVGTPWKTQERVREILRSQYQNAPDGISGNEDCGQMSSWYVLSAMGFYPVVPGSDYYVIGSPLVQHAKINLENGNAFEVTSSNNSDENIYIQSVSLNDRAYGKSYIRHSDIMAGGNLHFVMGNKPNENWGVKDEYLPISNVDDSTFVHTPYFSQGDLSFKDHTTIKLASQGKGDRIFYGLKDGQFHEYQPTDSIVLSEGATLCCYGQRGGIQSPIICTDFYKRDHSMSIDLASEYSNIYTGGSEDALIDGLRGGEDFRTEGWQGFEGQDLEYTVDLGEARPIHQVQCGFLQDENSWIFFPKSVAISISKDKQSFQRIGEIKPKTSPKEKGVYLQNFSAEADGKEARYIHVKAKSHILCPPWHKGAEFEGKAWLFSDEITIE